MDLGDLLELIEPLWKILRFLWEWIKNLISLGHTERNLYGSGNNSRNYRSEYHKHNK